MNQILNFKQHLNIVRRKIRLQMVRFAKWYLKSTYGFQCAHCRSPTPVLHVGKYCDQCLIAKCRRVLNPSDIW